MIHLLEGSDLRGHVSALESDVGALVAHLVAVVGCAEHCQHLSSLLILKAFRLDFMTPNEQICKERVKVRLIVMCL